MYFSLAFIASLLATTAFASPLHKPKPPPKFVSDLTKDGNYGSSAKRALPAKLIAGLKKDKNTGSLTKRSGAKFIRGLENLPDYVKRDLQAMISSSKAESSNELAKRGDGSRYNCGKKPWVPVKNWKDGYTLFCGGHTGPGNALKKGSEENSDDFIENGTGWVSMVYNTKLTNQDDGQYKKGYAGPPGHIYYFMHNSKMSPTGFLEYDDCLRYEQKQANTDSNCYGDDHKDTKGGAWNAPNFGLVGGLVYEGHVQE
ncbi:hypothetical protein B0O99DRAFT_248222 [Bisporella sp. PMI_857]|nr:hypothetical protein B0O99DRAFT_248222 [Bisporella sp. PMI_857]